VIKLSIPTTMYGLDLFDRLKINEGAVEHFRTHDHPAIRLAGELLYRRRAHEVKRDYAGPLGDAGAMVMLTNPELFVTEPLPVYINLQGVGRGQTIVDRGAIPDDQLARDRRACRESESLWIWTWQTVAGGSIRAAIWSGVAQPVWLATAARMAARS
jgi:pyrimidine-specific ribonucleoside hydrolase